MSAIAVDAILELDPPQAALRPLAHVVPLDDLAPLDDFEPWELHSELVLVDPELRRRSLELPPAPVPQVSVAPWQPILLPVPSAVEEHAERGVARAMVGYAIHRVVDIARMGFMIVGVVFTIAAIADVIPH